jgi:beta-phosphoglucomutase
MKYRAVLFDYDGVVANTMEDNYSAWQFAFSRYGIQLDRLRYFRMEGMTPLAVAGSILEENGLDPGLAAEIAREKERYYIAHHISSLHDGIESLVSALKTRGRLVGLVSGASRERLHGSGIAWLLGQFDVVITSDAVARGKPDPEPYQLAAQRLEVSPANCLAIENAPLGIASAKSALMDCIAVCTTLDREYLGEADMVVDGIADLVPIMNNIDSLEMVRRKKPAHHELK